MEQLIHIIGKIDIIKHPSFVLPHFAIGQDTAKLDNSFHWIQVWNQNYSDWHDNRKSHENDQELIRRENALQKLVKSSHKNIEDYPSILANWASKAGRFPTFEVKVKGVKMELGEYWEKIIIACATEKAIFNIPENDLKELIDHCEDEISLEGSIYSVALMRHLRRGAMMQQNYLGLGDIDLSSKEGTAYRILSPETSAEDANIQSMIDTAPIQEPNKKDYPDLISYIKAKGRWMVAQKYLTPSTSSSSHSSNEPSV